MGPTRTLFARDSCLYRDHDDDDDCSSGIGRWVAIAVIIVCMALLIAGGYWVIRRRRARGGQPLDGMGWMAPVGTVGTPNRDQVLLNQVHHVDSEQGHSYVYSQHQQPPPPQYTPGNYFNSHAPPNTPHYTGGDTANGAGDPGLPAYPPPAQGTKDAQASS